MTATELLKNDHAEAASMMDELEGAGGASAGRETFGRLKAALTLHTEMEEQIFYPALEEFDETRGLIQEAYKEHRQVKELLSRMDGQGGDFSDNLSELRGAVEHHVEEEENDLFPKAERLLGESRLQEMGRRMEEMKRGRAAAAGAGDWDPGRGGGGGEVY